ncbi:hypothetical protein JZ751_013645 [Albula glossodonta]|uniref:Uncharacterized protein n=1 Tax=Albula glossodonta TaxID=121402 RepID=A0A8T2NTE3_9TELE|nr:hypothetical protein JZ751_013645 [Albula glossodonta]
MFILQVLCLPLLAAIYTTGLKSPSAGYCVYCRWCRPLLVHVYIAGVMPSSAGCYLYYKS